MDDGLAAHHGVGHRVGVEEIDGHGLRPHRLEHGGRLGAAAHRADVVTGGEERRDGGATGDAGGTGEEHLHAVASWIQAAPAAIAAGVASCRTPSTSAATVTARSDARQARSASSIARWMPHGRR